MCVYVRLTRITTRIALQVQRKVGTRKNLLSNLSGISTFQNATPLSWGRIETRWCVFGIHRVHVRILVASVGVIVAGGLLHGQTTPSWKRIAGTTINEALAEPASEPASAVWYAAGSRALLAQTASGRVFETTDFVHWRLSTSGTVPATSFNAGLPLSLPEPGAKVQSVPGRLYAMGSANLYTSEDNGRTWLNLTGFNNRSVIGGGFNELAISPANPQEISAANLFGVWRSLDGGLTWQGLNEDLPNLTVRKLLGHRTILLADGTLVEAGLGGWIPTPGSDPELPLRAQFGGAIHADVSAVGESAGIAYAGTADGRLLVSRDGGKTWNENPGGPLGSAVARFWVDGERPEVALAAAGSHLFRTVNGGLFWDQVTGALPPGQIHGIAADRSAGFISFRLRPPRGTNEVGKLDHVARCLSSSYANRTFCRCF